jgi:tetratricopeptide (TPR) repeat protein
MPAPIDVAGDERLLAAIGEYYASRRPGEPFDPGPLLSKYAEIAPALRDFLEGVECVDRLARPDERQRSFPAEAKPVGRPAAIGDYTIERELGSGGRGVVYRASQRSTKRVVALKMIRTERRAATETIDRFQTEIHAVAALDHPNIVPIYEVGQFEGRPFFTMKLLEGGPLSGHLAEYRDDPAAAARIIFTIAKALEEAHTRGILHRDVKPQNILLDAAGNAYLTDFGLAKLCGGDLDLTKSTAALGSPQYMAPEQAEGRSRDVTTAADLYGLGATLYALLTGRPPHESDSLFELLHRIQSGEPEPPRRINSSVPADLEVICLKCLRKERSERYQSAGELADDLHAYLHGLPIRARPMGAIARGWLWCRRNRSVAALSATLACALFAGTVASTVFWRIAESRLAGMHKSYRLSRHALDESVRTIIEHPEFKKGSLERLRLDVLATQLDFHERFVREHRGEATFAADLAQSHMAIGRAAAGIGEIDRALRHLRAARQMLETLALSGDPSHRYETLLGICWSEIAWMLDDQNRPLNEIEQAYGNARQILERQVSRSDRDSETVLSLADTLKNLGSLRRKTGRVEEAGALHRRSIELARTVYQASGSPQSQALLAAGLNELGYTCEVLRQKEEARTAYIEAVRLYDNLLKVRADDPEILSDLAYAHSNLASIIGVADPAAAEAEHAKAMRIWENLAADHPDIVKYRVRLAETYSYYADCLRECDRFAEALAAYETTVWMLENLREPGSERGIAGRMIGYARHGSAKVYRKQNRRDEATASLKRALDAYTVLAVDFPEMHEAIGAKAEICEALAGLCQLPDEREMRIEFCRGAVENRRRIVDLTPANLGYAIALLDAVDRLATVLASAGQQQELYQLCQESIRRVEPLLAGQGISLRERGRLEGALARIYRHAGQPDRAERAYRESVELTRTRLRRNSENRRSCERLATALRELGEFLDDRGETGEARPLLLESLRLHHDCLPTHKHERETRWPALEDRLVLAELSRLEGQPQDSLAHLDAALAAISAQDAQVAAPQVTAPQVTEARVTSDEQGRKLAAAIHVSRAKSLSALDRAGEAITHWDLAIGFDREDSASLRIHRAYDLARAGRTADAANVIREISSRPELKPGELRAAAGVLAQCAGATAGDSAPSHDLADQAIELLRRAIARGYRNVGSWEQDGDLAVLRPRPGFDRLIKEIRMADATR